MKIHAIITTYNRREMLLALLGDLAREQAAGADLFVMIFDDGTPPGNQVASDEIAAILKADSFRLIRMHRNHGKARYWQLVTATWQTAYRLAWDRLCMLPDDVRLSDPFFSECERVWQAIEDPKKLVLNPLLDTQRQNVPCWTPINPTPRRHSGVAYRHVGWNDLCLYSERAFLDALNQGRLRPIPMQRWQRDPALSSGVGAQVSTRLYAGGYGMYQVSRSLVFHGDHESQLNPQERKRNGLTAKP